MVQWTYGIAKGRRTGGRTLYRRNSWYIHMHTSTHALGAGPRVVRGRYIRFNCSVSYSLHVQLGGSVTETPTGISAPPLRYRHIPLLGAPVSAHGRAVCHPIARVCVPLDAVVTRVTCTCPARRGCHSCDGEPRRCPAASKEEVSGSATSKHAHGRVVACRVCGSI